MKVAHEGLTLKEWIGEETVIDESKWSHEFAAEHEFGLGLQEVQDHAVCDCGAEIFPSDKICTGCAMAALSFSETE